MLLEDRKSYICNLLEHQPSVTVKELSTTLDVSEVTIRKLLIQMEQEDLLRRSWGGAVRISNATQELPYVEKENRHLAEKQAIARAAYDLLREDETIYLDCGTTSFELVRQIVQGPKHLVVCTNAFNILAELRQRPDLSSIMIGGELRPAIYSCVGTLTVRMLEMLVFDRAFLTGDHFSIEHGFTVSMPRDAAVKQAAIHSAKRSYVIMDSSKYGEDSMAVITKADSRVSLITDWRISPQVCDEFRKHGTSVIAAPEASATV